VATARKNNNNKMKTRILALMLFLGLTNIHAADNKVYIDQVGDRSTITITQDGSSNTVKGVGIAQDQNAKIYGDDTMVAITQTGVNNFLTLGVNGGALGSTNVINYSVTGNNATSLINCNNAETGKCNRNNISITQTGNNATSNVSVNGENNALTGTSSGGANNSINFNITGDGLTPNIAISGGGGNTGNITLAPSAGINATATMTIAGASNNVSINQTGGSVLGHSASLQVNGSSNTIAVTQTGTMGDNKFNLQSTGSTNSVTINQNAQ
jgi:hypothetical protein